MPFIEESASVVDAVFRKSETTACAVVDVLLNKY
jgi:hypothetical protein